MEVLTRRELMASAVGAPLAGAGRPILTGSFFDLIHVNAWDATYWTDTCRETRNNADIYKDGFIDLADFALLANNWLKQGANLMGDINTDDSVNITDLKILLYHWLETCQ